jgi:hypothetical protein
MRSAIAFVLTVAAVPAHAAERVEMELECSAMRPGWTAPRVFTVAYVGGKKRLQDVIVTEKARVFTPTDEKSLYVTRGKGKRASGVIVTVPDKREGKWSGKAEDEGDAFELKARDGRASFVLAPAPANDKLRLLTWQADMEVAKGEELSWQGEGTCRIVSTGVDASSAAVAEAPPTPKAEATAAPKADATPAPKKPRKEIRLFGGRKRASADGGEASQ